MRSLTLFSMTLVVALVSCKSHKPVAVQPGEAAEIPREVAVQKLGEQLSYADILDVKLELAGKYYTVKVYTTIQVDRARDHFQFLWKAEDHAKQVTELLLSLKRK